MSSTRFTLRAAVYLMPLKNNQILLLRRFNTGWMDGNYSLISGHIDGNETVTDAMIRETKEEACIVVTREHILPATVIHRKSPDQEYIDFFFAVQKWEGEPSIGEADKCDDLSWFELDKLPPNILPHVKDAINNYKNKVAFSESGWKLPKP